MFDRYTRSFTIPGCPSTVIHPEEHMSATDENNGDNTIPTEEIYLELEELQSATNEHADSSPRPATSDDDPSGVKARIARLRAMLSDRGAPLDE